MDLGHWRGTLCPLGDMVVKARMDQGPPKERSSFGDSCLGVCLWPDRMPGRGPLGRLLEVIFLDAALQGALSRPFSARIHTSCCGLTHPGCR